jgi:ketosteroid isomerase-like protein
VPQAEIETLRAGYEAFNRGEIDSLLDAADPDIEFQPADRAVNAGVVRGKVAIQQFFEDLFEPFEQVDVQPQKFFESEDRIAVILQAHFRPRGSNAVVENRIGHVWTFRDGKALRLEIYPEREKALEAIGMSPQEARAEAARGPSDALTPPEGG